MANSSGKSAKKKAKKHYYMNAQIDKNTAQLLEQAKASGISPETFFECEIEIPPLKDTDLEEAFSENTEPEIETAASLPQNAAKLPSAPFEAQTLAMTQLSELEQGPSPSEESRAAASSPVISREVIFSEQDQPERAPIDAPDVSSFIFSLVEDPASEDFPPDEPALTGASTKTQQSDGDYEAAAFRKTAAPSADTDSFAGWSHSERYEEPDESETEDKQNKRLSKELQEQLRLKDVINADGYYDDILPSDVGATLPKMNKKKVVALAAVGGFIVLAFLVFAAYFEFIAI